MTFKGETFFKLDHYDELKRNNFQESHCREMFNNFPIYYNNPK